MGFRGKALTYQSLKQAVNGDDLNLTGRGLTSLPEEIGQFTGLRTLTLRGNQIATLPPEIGRLANLRMLNLDDNALAALPPEIGDLAALEVLSVQSNHLVELPHDIGRLAGLRLLDVADNRLTSLPPELAPLLTAGLTFDGLGNPWREPYPRLLGRGPKALAAYLSSLTDAVTLHEADLLLVGDAGAGKTCLTRALREMPLDAHGSATHGVEIHPLTVRHPRLGTDIALRAWDFGGRPDYRIAHQFFFSPRAVYLVVWKPREGQERTDVEGWLRRVRVRVGDVAQILIVATHCDDRHFERAFARLRTEFAGLVAGCHSVDSRSGTGIDELRTAIAAQVAGLPQVGQRLSRRWVAVRDEILGLAAAEPQISYQRYLAACARHGVSGEEAASLVELLHDLGQVVHFGDDEGLRDIVVLDPAWLAKAISHVLEDGPTRSARGILDHSRLKQVWSEHAQGAGYPAQCHPYLLRLMEKLDVSRRLADDEHRSLVGQLVPDGRPELPWDADTPVAEGTRALTLICELSEPAPGLIPWLTVRHHRASTGLRWSGGVFLQHPASAHASQALLQTRLDGRLTLQVRAPTPELFFNVLRDSIEHLARTRWPGLTYEIHVPCPTRRADGTACDGHFEVVGLLRYRQRGNATYPCLRCLADHDIATLVDGLADPGISALQDDLRQLQHEMSAGNDEVLCGIVKERRYATGTANYLRQVIKAVGAEVTDCPRLFTIAPRSAAGRRWFRFFERHYRVTLWCEHPDAWHPCPGAEYDISQPREWLANVAPYVWLVLTTLRLTVPVAGGVAGAVLDEERLRAVAGHLDLMRTLVDKLPTQLSPDRDLDVEHASGHLTPAQGRALRGFRMTLLRSDPAHAFGGLRRVQEASGEHLWVCPDHYHEHDPGLPILP